MKTKYVMLMLALLCALPASAIYRVSLLSHKEMAVDAGKIMNLSGLGLGILCGSDSVMLIDNPELAVLHWAEPNNARSIVGCGSAFYAADGDSIYRIATDLAPRKFIGRLDNEQFTLAPATDSTFYAITADEDFSCVYEINPVTGYCDPVISIKAPLLKIARLGENLLLWVDDTIMIAKNNDSKLVPLYSAPDILDVEVSPIGTFVATGKSVIWFTGLGEGVDILSEGVTHLWWDNDDILYYRNMAGDILGIVGLEEFYRTATQSN